MTGLLRMVQRNALVYRRAWRGSLFSSFLQPTLFLFAIGLQVGRLVDRGGASLPNGVRFLDFLAPGLLAGTCMQMATFESSFPIMNKMSWRRNYEAMLTTPLRVTHLVAGELVWIALRLSMGAVVFTLVMTAFGVPRSFLAPAGAVLTGLAFSAPLMAYAATLKGNDNFNVVFRFVISPLFLFSGVFFPISRLPHTLQVAAQFTPLFHGVELVRGLTLGTLTSPAWMVHVTYLVGMIAIGMVAAFVTFDRRLHP